jgi:hypothetical protein
VSAEEKLQIAEIYRHNTAEAKLAIERTLNKAREYSLEHLSGQNWSANLLRQGVIPTALTIDLYAPICAFQLM